MGRELDVIVNRAPHTESVNNAKNSSKFHEFTCYKYLVYSYLLRFYDTIGRCSLSLFGCHAVIIKEVMLKRLKKFLSQMA